MSIAEKLPLGIVRKYRHVVLNTLEVGSETHVASGLAANCITKTRERPSEVVTPYVTKKFQAGITRP